MDAEYIFSLMSPEYSDNGTAKQVVEDCIMDNYQDCLIALEDESICGFTKALAWKDDNQTEPIPGNNWKCGWQVAG